MVTSLQDVLDSSLWMFFAFHARIGLTTLLLSIYFLINGIFFNKKHCDLGRIISALAAIALLTGLMLSSDSPSFENQSINRKMKQNEMR